MGNRRTYGPNREDPVRGYADTAMEFPSELWTCLHDFFLCTLALVVSLFSRFAQKGAAYMG